MPEIKRNFLRGKMNKDLDERLVPNGEYRDALNVQISSSEDNDVGAVQNIRGTKEIFPTTQVAALNAMGSPKCIGVIANGESNKIYWFIAGTSKDGIAEYDTATGTVTPILISDTALNFTSDYKITGINVITGDKKAGYSENDVLLFWTDNQSEPKQINITKYKEDYTTSAFNVNTQINSVNVKESDITVIKKSPLNAPTLTMSATKKEGNLVGTGNNPAFCSFNFSTVVTGTSTYELKQEGEEHTFDFTPLPNFDEGDELIFSGSQEVDNVLESFKVRVKVTELLNEAQQIKGEILSIDTNVPVQASAITYEVLVDEGDSLFELKIPRFAYRWKYKGGQYSCFSPFSEPAFLPSRFDYASTDGHNKSMVNSLRALTISGFDTKPYEVEEIDILYKESNNNIVYVVKTLKNNETSFKVEREIFSSVVEENQLLRHFDNVPKKALAQEIVANRVVYGNYTQNYTIDKENEIDLDLRFSKLPVSQSQSFKANGSNKTFTLTSVYFSAFPTRKEDLLILIDDDITSEEYSYNADTYAIVFENAPANNSIVTISFNNINIPQKSIKTLRNYQAGMAFVDKYGRTSPVFTSSKSSKYIDLQHSSGVVKLHVKPTNIPPSWATHYKIYLKEGSSEYYNLVLDRYYEAEDGNIWLSFPSSEANKVQKGDFLTLKKQHDTGESVTSNNKFKILDVRNTAPEFITTSKISKSSSSVKVKSSGAQLPIPGSLTFDFVGPDDSENAAFARGFTGNTFVRIKQNDNISAYYAVSVGGPAGIKDGSAPHNTLYEVTLKEPLSQSDTFLHDIDTAGEIFTIELHEEIKELTSEFEGRFFAKVKRNDIIDTHIIDTSASTNITYDTVFNTDIDINLDKAQARRGTEQLAWKDVHNPISTQDSSGNFVNMRFNNIDPQHPSLNRARILIVSKSPEYKRVGSLGDNIYLTKFEKGFREDGTTRIQFENTDGQKSKVYRVFNLDIRSVKRNKGDSAVFADGTVSDVPHTYADSLRHEISFDIEDDQKNKFFSEDGFDITENTSTNTYRINKVYLKQKRLSIENVLASANPAVFETEPKEVADLDFYHEVSNTLGVIKVGMTVSGTGISGTPTVTNVTPSIINFSTNQTLALNTVLTFTDSTNNITATATVAGATSNVASVKIKNGGYFGQLELDWFNCYTYGNGVESNRIRDDFNAPFIDKGPKVSTVLDTPYIEEHRKNGLIYSGIYNSTSGINKLNQFIAGEKITKDLNPEYGSIQKLHTRDTDLTVLCEDKVLKVLANKDALFNADGNINLTSTNNVLGQAVPYAGNYGISKNPESFASYGYRAYFADKSRGSVLRLSRDGITPISSNGMKNWFKTNLKNATTILGYYNDKQDEYDISLQGTTDYTLSFDEKTTGWVSFKSYIPEAGLCLNNIHYTFKNARIWSHDNEDENQEFYGVSSSTTTNPYITLIFNDAPNVIKSFKTINYEGSQAYQREIHAPGMGYVTFDKFRDTSSSTYSLSAINDFDARSIAGWKVSSAITDINSGDAYNFIRKENKWFSNLNKDVFAYENNQFVSNASGYGGNLDPSELTFQGVGRIKANGLTGDTTQTKYKVRIETSGVGAKNMTLTSVSGPGTWVLYKTNPNNGIVQNDNVSTLDSIEPVVLTFTCHDGFENPGSQALATQSPSGTFNSVAYAQPTTTTNTVSLSFASATLSADKHITITLNNAATAITTEKSIAGTYNYNVRNTSTPNSDLAVPVNTAYNNTGTKGLTEVLITRTITAKAGHGFGRLVDGIFEEDTPTAIIEQQGDETGVYSISTANRVLQDGKLTSIDIVVSYTYGEKSTVTGDKIIFFARAKALHSAPADKVKGYFWTRINDKNVHVPDASDIDIDGETRYLNIWGEAGATFGVTCSTATVFMDGSLNNITSKTLNAKTDLNRIRVDFPAAASTTTHTFTLTGSDLDSSIAGGNPFTLTQVANVTITFQPHSLRYANAQEVTVFEDDNLDGTFNTAANTADNITRTFRAYSSPQLNTKFSEIPFKYVFNDGAAANVTRTITADDFSNTVSTANGGTVMRVEDLAQTVATNNLTITGKYVIEKYGNTSFTTQCAQGNIEGSGSGTGSIIYLSVTSGSNISNATLTSGNQLIVGHTDYQSGDVISGTATITIDCPGYLAGDVTLSYDALDGVTNNNSATNPTFSGTGTSSTSATFNWSFTLNENVDSGDTFGFRVNASLDTP